MFTETARGALTTETRGQNSFYNTRNQGFAEQKVALLPKEFWEVPKTFEKQYRVIKFQAGLIPVLKHGTGDQKPHGSWANGYTAEETARMDELSNSGPALEDLDEILNSMQSPNPGLGDFRMIVENDQDMYESATEGIDERVAAALARNQEISPNHEFTAQEKSELYENVQRDMIDAYIDENSDDLHADYEASMGLGDTQKLLYEAQAFFEDIYNTEHAVENSAGEYVTSLSSEVTSVDALRNDVGGEYRDTIVLNGKITDDDDNFAGEFQRVFYKKDGVWMVEHSLLKIQDGYKGLGFGKQFIQRQEDWYAQRGFGAITVSTAWDGARVWARSGFDWDTRRIARDMIELNDNAANDPDFRIGTPVRKEFDALMSRVFSDYSSNESGWSGTKMRKMTEENFPLPSDFAMIGYSAKESSTYISPVTQEEKVEYTWAGQRFLQDRNLHYTKVLTAEGRNLFEGPIDRDGDGLVYDGTSREKPVSTVKS